MIDIKLYKINYYDYKDDKLNLKGMGLYTIFSDSRFALRNTCILFLSALLNTENQVIVIFYMDDDLLLEPIVMYLTLSGIRIPSDYEDFSGMIIKELIEWVKNANYAVVQSTTAEISKLIS